MVQSVETSNDMSHLQLLLCIFQQGDEGPLGAFGQLVGGHTDVQPVLPKARLPSWYGSPPDLQQKKRSLWPGLAQSQLVLDRQLHFCFYRCPVH